MQTTWRWFERGFVFDFPAQKLGEILERLRGTPCRVEELLRGTPTDLLTHRRDASWSIQENVGHLADLEPLWAARIDEVVGGGGRDARGGSEEHGHVGGRAQHGASG